MKKRLAALSCLACLAGAAEAAYRANMSVIAGEGTGRSVGQVTIAESTQGGVIITPNLRHLPPGQHALHLQEGSPCGGAPARRRPLPAIEVNEFGFASRPFAVSNLSLESLRDKSLVVEAEGHRLPSGETADRVACGVIARAGK